MSSSVVDIANIALNLLGAEPINALTDDTVTARTINLHYGPSRDKELIAHDWRFSIKRTTLPALAAVPLGSDFSLQYELPADFLGVSLVGDSFPGQDRSDYRQRSTAEYSIEGGLILTNYSAPLNLRYNSLVEDSSLFDPAFVLALAAQIAASCCKKITGDDALVTAARAYYKEAIRDAIQSNALLSPPDHRADDSWMMARLG